MILAGIQSLQRDLAISLAWQLSSCREEFLQLGGKTNFAALIVVVLTSSNEPSAEVGATLSAQTRA